MSSFDHDLRHLAARAGRGDQLAKAELERELEPHMYRIVRRAMRTNAGDSALTERVRAAARRLSRDDSGHPEQLVNQIAECVAKRDVAALRDRIDELATMKEWLLLDKFDRGEVNRRLRQYAADDDEWRWQ